MSRSLLTKAFAIGIDKVDAICCVHGLAPLHRWTDECKINREKFDAPANVVAYNLFMNAVDRMDQQRQPVACQQHEKHVSMTHFTLILDLACSNGYAVGCTLSTQYKPSVRFDEFKRHTAEQLTRPWHEERSKKASIKSASNKIKSPPACLLQACRVLQCVSSLSHQHEQV
jgi:hypothetical protein